MSDNNKEDPKKPAPSTTSGSAAKGPEKLDEKAKAAPGKPDQKNDGGKADKPKAAASTVSGSAKTTPAGSQAANSPQAAASATAQTGSANHEQTSVAPPKGPSPAWKGAALALFVIAGFLAVTAYNYRSDLNQAQGEMAQVRAEVEDERKAMLAEQAKFVQDSKDIAAAVEAAKQTLAETRADIQKHRSEATELEGKLTGLYAETEAALKAASEAATKQAAAQTLLDNLIAEHGKLNSKVETARTELGVLEQDAEGLLKNLKGALGKIRGALDNL